MFHKSAMTTTYTAMIPRVTLCAVLTLRLRVASMWCEDEVEVSVMNSSKSACGRADGAIFGLVRCFVSVIVNVERLTKGSLEIYGCCGRAFAAPHSTRDRMPLYFYRRAVKFYETSGEDCDLLHLILRMRSRIAVS